MKILDVSQKTIQRELKKLKEAKHIERIGSNKVGFWEIMDYRKIYCSDNSQF